MVLAIQEYNLPSLGKELYFFGLVNFNRRFISHVAERPQVVTDLLQSNLRTLILADAARVAFAEIKRSLS